MHGEGGTQIENIAWNIVDNDFANDELYIFTDGDVDV